MAGQTDPRVDAFLAALPEDQRSALEQLRGHIRDAAPEADETISYGVPAYRQKNVLVSFGAAKNHCAFYVMSPAVMEAHAADLEGLETSKGGIRFTPERPLPPDLVQKLVRARIAETQATKRK